MGLEKMGLESGQEGRGGGGWWDGAGAGGATAGVGY